MGYYDNLWYDYTWLPYQVVRRMLSIGPYQSCSFEKQFVWICVISRYCFKDFDLQTAEYTRALENFWCPPCRIRHGFGRDRNTFLAFRLQMASCYAFGQALGSIQCHCGGVRLVECCWCVFEVGVWLISVDVKTYYDIVLGCSFLLLGSGQQFYIHNCWCCHWLVQLFEASWDIICSCGRPSPSTSTCQNSSAPDTLKNTVGTLSKLIRKGIDLESVFLILEMIHPWQGLAQRGSKYLREVPAKYLDAFCSCCLGGEISFYKVCLSLVETRCYLH